MAWARAGIKDKTETGASLLSFSGAATKKLEADLESTQYISNQFLSCLERGRGPCAVCVKYLLPSPVWKSRDRVPPRTLLTAEECAKSQTQGLSLPTLDPASIFQRSGRGHEWGIGIRAESSFPWRIAGMTSCKVSTSLADLFSQVAFMGRSAQGVYGVLAASSASHNLRWSLQSHLSPCQVVLALSIKLLKSSSLY